MSSKKLKLLVNLLTTRNNKWCSHTQALSSSRCAEAVRRRRVTLRRSTTRGHPWTKAARPTSRTRTPTRQLARPRGLVGGWCSPTIRRQGLRGRWFCTSPCNRGQRGGQAWTNLLPKWPKQPCTNPSQKPSKTQANVLFPVGQNWPCTL